MNRDVEGRAILAEGDGRKPFGGIRLAKQHHPVADGVDRLADKEVLEQGSQHLLERNADMAPAIRGSMRDNPIGSDGDQEPERLNGRRGRLAAALAGPGGAILFLLSSLETVPTSSRPPSGRIFKEV